MADTRDRILAATNESFRRRGYHGTSIKDVTPVPHNGCRQPKRRRT